MRYRIRYEQRSELRQTEIEAHSPHEAVVKFEQIQDSRRRDDRARVTSVSAVEGGEKWG